ncbi:MAG: hypothetical protein ACW974_04405, partial [Candidatus Thorarchaeota archaeon]
MSELSFGNYSLLIDSSRWIVHLTTPYRVVVSLGLENHSRTTLNLYITIVNIPTALTADNESILMAYLETFTIRVFYYDIWQGHNNQGIPGGDINANSSNTDYIDIEERRPDPSAPGWYEITLSSKW